MFSSDEAFKAFKPTVTIAGTEKGMRVDSRILEERIQRAVADGHRFIEIIAQGQHGIGGRLWRAGQDPVLVRVLGTSGQRVGSMAFPNTLIEVVGPASDDVGWLNAGAHIVVLGHATNGVANAMSQGKIYIAGDIGARGMTMTKHNPRFAPPELWVLGKVGDSFAEFMAGGIAVVCGHTAERTDNVLGYRPGVGMVGGKIFFRGPHRGFSDHDVRCLALDDEDWRWLKEQLVHFLAGIRRETLWGSLTADRNAWSVLVARKPHEKTLSPRRDMGRFRRDIWDRELGTGGLIGDLTDLDRRPIELLPSGVLRRFVPVWENERHLSPCQAHCPTGIPVQKRWELIRQGRMEEAVNLALVYTPFPATICGHLCPNLCMQHCSRQGVSLPPLDVSLLGRASLEAEAPQPAPPTGKRIAVVGGGAAGLSVAWQLWMKGHEPVILEQQPQLGGKITAMIPESRIPAPVVAHELKRIHNHLSHRQMKKALTRQTFETLRSDYDFVVVATGALRPRRLSVPGGEGALAAADFLRRSKKNRATVGKKVVIIGAGNVGCDAAAEAARLGAEDITLVDIQEPAAYGKERAQAEKVGARFLWPRTVRAISGAGVELTTGEFLPADSVIVAVGDLPDLGFLPEDICTEKGFIAVNERFQTSDPRVFAIGDAVRPGLLTEAIGAGRVAARVIDGILRGLEERYDQLPAILPERVKLEYYNPRILAFADTLSCASNCASCGVCRDCGLCEQICPQAAITRSEKEEGSFAYECNGDRCIGCGFCAGACPTGVWALIENESME